ncbi:MAG: leucine-rich repeat domain-containing protein, partial [Clostridia bacterium]|nr:leucine-rich repeat domain-containing protein [Clostridia bacterium]
KKIGEGAFEDCTGLTSVTIPDSVTEIDTHAFEGCTGLTSVTIPNSVTRIGGSAFEGCTGLTSVTILEGVKKIGEGAFEDCTGLTSVTIPDSVTEIGEGAFSGCTGLTSVTIPDSVKKIIRKDVFEGCPCKSQTVGCYVATGVYGSYDCPEVWTLRRYRDYTLAETWYGRTFIRIYYAISPTIVKWFGNTHWFKQFWKRKLDCMVAKLKADGVEDTPYQDREW